MNLAEIVPPTEPYRVCQLEKELYHQYRSDLDLSELLADFTTPEKTQARQQFWQNVQQLLTYLDHISAVLTKDSDTQNHDSSNLFDAVDMFKKLIASLRPISEQFPDLNQHLDKVTAYANQLCKVLASETPMETPLQASHLHLIAKFVAPLHDIIKHLGSFDSQISTDHQLVMRHIFTTYRLFFELDEAEANFVGAVAGDHENATTITRSELLKAPESSMDNDSEELAIIHAKVIFYLIDTFTDMFQPEAAADKTLRLDPAALHQRLTGILERWNDPALTPNINPSWALTAYQDFAASLDLLSQYQVTVPAETKLVVLESIINTYRQLLVTFAQRTQDQAKMAHFKRERFDLLPSAEPKEFEQVIQKLEQSADQERREQRQANINTITVRLEGLINSLTASDSIGARLARGVQASYQATAEHLLFEPAAELDLADYAKLDPVYQAFNLMAVSSTVNLLHTRLHHPQTQTALLDFLSRTQTESINIEAMLDDQNLRELAFDLAAHLHNQYELVLGEQNKLWLELDTSTDRPKKIKSVAVASQLLLNTLNYLKLGRVEQLVPLDITHMRAVANLNFNADRSDVQSFLQAASSSEKNNWGSPIARVVAEASHQFWLTAKLASGSNDQALEVDKDTIGMPVKIKSADGAHLLDPAMHPFVKLHPAIQRKNEVAARMAVSNLEKIMANTQNVSEPLHQLPQLIKYLFVMLKSSDNQQEHQQWLAKQPKLVATADLLTARQQELWLMHHLSKEGGLDRLGELGQLRHFSVWADKNEQERFALLHADQAEQQIDLSFRDLDRVPVLMAAIALYFDYLFFMLEEEKTVKTNLGEHKEQLEQVLEVVSRLEFPGLDEIKRKIEDL